MLTVRTRQDLRSFLDAARMGGARVGFVPTMGALHEGHLRLVDTVREQCDIVVMSVYVNPLQFGPGEDFTKYPRDLDTDSVLAEQRGVDLLFAPSDSEMNMEQNGNRRSAGKIGEEWEGRLRPGHFDGVATVVAELLNIVRPDVVAFGQKDLQQVAVVRALIENLEFPVDLLVMPTIREQDGLALSSRNRFLSPPQRMDALVLSRALHAMKSAFAGGEVDSEKLEASGRHEFLRTPAVTPDYVAVVDPRTFIRKRRAAPGDAAIVAAKVGTTRLIDNVIL